MLAVMCTRRDEHKRGRKPKREGNENEATNETKRKRNQTKPNQATPNQTRPHHTTPHHTTPHHTRPHHTTPHHTTPHHTTPHHTTPHQRKPNKTKQNNTKQTPPNRNQTKPNQTKPNQTPPKPQGEEAAAEAGGGPPCDQIPGHRGEKAKRGEAYRQPQRCRILNSLLPHLPSRTLPKTDVDHAGRRLGRRGEGRGGRTHLLRAALVS